MKFLPATAPALFEPSSPPNVADSGLDQTSPSPDPGDDYEEIIWSETDNDRGDSAPNIAFDGIHASGVSTR